MKTYAPKHLHGEQLAEIMADLPATPAQVAKFLRVSERTVWRWLADKSAPYPVLAALWHETPHGRHVTAVDVGNELAIERGLANSLADAHARANVMLSKVLRIADTGAANDPLINGPASYYRATYPPQLQPLPLPLVLALM